MAQEFASDNSKTGLFSRLKLSNHRGFFSFIFVTLSIIFILITFAAIQQQQTTQSKAANNLCDHVQCDKAEDNKICLNNGCCNPNPQTNKCESRGITKYCSTFSDSENACKGNVNPSEAQLKVFDIRQYCEWSTERLAGGECIDIDKSTTNPIPTPTRTPLEAKCYSYGLGANGDVTCAAKAAQNNVECKWEGSPTVGKCVPGSVSTTSTTVIPTVGSGQQCLDSNKNTIARCSFPFICEVGSGTCKVIQHEVVCDSCRNVGEGCSITGSIPCPGYKCSPLTSGSTVGKCVRTTTTGNACDSCTAVGQGCSVTGSIPCHGFKCSPISAGSTVGTCKSTTTQPPPPPRPGGGDPDSACTSISGRCLTGQTGREGKDCKAVTGQAGTGKIQSGLCSGSADRKCCVPNSSTGTGTKVTCANFTTQDTCLPPDQCTWGTKKGTADTKICQRVCGRIPDQPTCDKRSDCNWKNNQCVNKSGSGPSENVGDADLNLKLSFQGIVTLPKTKTELKVKVRLVDVENREKENDASTFTADANGIWSGKVSFENVDLSQKYYLLIKGPMHVQKKICKADAADPNPGYYSCQFGNITLNSGSNDFDFSQVKMLVGDLDQNGIVDREDTGPLLNALLLDLDQRKSTGILEKLDLNLDGIVEPKDWSLMLEALKIKYDEK